MCKNEQVDRQAVDVFIEVIEECRVLHEKIGGAIDDHLGVLPDQVDWGNVGDAKRLSNRLAKAVWWLPKSKSLADRLADLAESADEILSVRQIKAGWVSDDQVDALHEHDDKVDDLVKRLQALANLAQFMEVKDE